MSADFEALDVAQKAHAIRLRLIGRGPLRFFVVLSILLAVCAATGLLAFRAGRHSAHPVIVLTVQAFSNGVNEATISAGGWQYGVTPDVAWISSDHEINEGTWPACLPRGNSEVTFGWVDTTHTTAERTVVWIRC